MQHIFALALSLTLSTFAAPAQDHHAALDRRGAQVMGFDQTATVHHFRLFADGGAIEVTVKEPSDEKNQQAIRMHLPHIATMFGQGNFEAPMLVHDSKAVPGTGVMSRRKDRIRYRYTHTPGGGRVEIITTDRDALAAVHEFLRFQITDHRTGDPLTITHRR